MCEFMDKDFLLRNEVAKKLYHDYAYKMAIFDFHNHLSAKEIYEDHCYENIAQAWLQHDHYKWRAMRAYGIQERLITASDHNDYERFLAYVKTIEKAIGNPLVHWTHLELQRYFGIYEVLNQKNAWSIWQRCNEKLRTRHYSIRQLLHMQNVVALCTTDDPIDSLIYHRKLREDHFKIKVLPTFRPDRALAIEKEDFDVYIKQLEEVVGWPITHIDQLIKALINRIEYFKAQGCVISDHSLEENIFVVTTKEEVEQIFKKRLEGQELSYQERSRYKGYLLISLAKAYVSHQMVMQLHIGALRNTSTRRYLSEGENIGCDAMQDRQYAAELSNLLDAMDKNHHLPKTIVYCLNPKDNEMLACLCGNFQGDGIKGKIQFGPAWWFNDHKKGIEKQIDALCSMGILGTSIGMVTDSRSYLSMSRHEYFRRILCNKIGMLVENGEYPYDINLLGEMVQDISYTNAKVYFGVEDI